MYAFTPSASLSASEKLARWVIWPPQTGTSSCARQRRANVTAGSFEFLALWRRRVENDGVGRASLPRERNGFLHGVDIKQSGPTRNYDERCRLDRFDDADRVIRRRIDEYPFRPVASVFFDNMRNAAFHDL